MNRNVRNKVDDTGKDKVDWTELLDDKVTHFFSCLNNRDRASLSSTCKAWWMLSKSTFLWQTLDLRFTNIDDDAATSLASRCGDLKKLRISGNEFVSSIVNLKASNLREISIGNCTHITDVTLSPILAPHGALECIQIGPGVNQMIHDTMKTIALRCQNLKKLLLTNIYYVNEEAINGLAQNCHNLTDMSFIDCLQVDEAALGNVTTLRFLSVSGTRDVNWNIATSHWSKLFNLACLDVSRTYIKPRDVSELLSSCLSLKVLSALNCPFVEHDPNFINRRGKVLVGFFTDFLKELSSLFVDMPKEKGNVFLVRRYSTNSKDRKLEGVLDWLEYVICDTLLCVAQNYTTGLDDFWLHQDTGLLCSFLQSPHEEVQEKATTALATFAKTDDVNRTEALLREDAIHFLVNLSRSRQEVLQVEAVKALVSLSRDSNVAKAVIDEGGVGVLRCNAKSLCKTMAREALGGKWILAPYDDNKSAFAEAGGILDLVEIIVRWSKSDGGEYVLLQATDALADLAMYANYRTEIASAGGFHALEPLLRTDMPMFVQETAARCLANMTSRNDSGENLAAAVRKETGIIKALVQLVRSLSDGVRKEAASALWNLSYDEGNRDEIAAVGGVEALVSLANSCENASNDLQAIAAGALWQLSVSEKNSIAIVEKGGVKPLIALAKSDAEEVYQMAVGAIMILASNAKNAMHIIEEHGLFIFVPHLSQNWFASCPRSRSCTCSTRVFIDCSIEIAISAKPLRRLDELVMVGTSSKSTSNSKHLCLVSARKLASDAIEVFLKSCSDPHAISLVASSLSPAPAAVKRVTELAHIEEAYAIDCSGLGRFLTMLSHPSPVIKSCCAFALLQFTLPEGKYASYYANLLRDAGARRKLRAIATLLTAPLEAKAFARVVLRNLEHLPTDHSR